MAAHLHCDEVKWPMDSKIYERVVRAQQADQVESRKRHNRNHFKKREKPLITIILLLLSLLHPCL